MAKTRMVLVVTALLVGGSSLVVTVMLLQSGKCLLLLPEFTNDALWR
jgi:hypothetical protein